MRSAAKNAEIRKLYAERRAEGLCGKCGEPALPGRAVCDDHAEIGLNSQQKKENVLRRRAYQTTEPYRRTVRRRYDAQQDIFNPDRARVRGNTSVPYTWTER
jgi:hypothetical protein